MRKTLAVVSLVACVLLLAASSLCAQGKATGLNRGLGHAATRAAAAATPGIQTATLASEAAVADETMPVDVFPGGTNQFDEAAAGANRGSRGLQRTRGAWWRGLGISRRTESGGASDAAGGLAAATESAQNFDRIRQKRLEQADHLRAVSEQNGNEALLETADRMEASAEANYLRQTGENPAEVTPMPADEPAAEGATATSTPPTDNVKPQRRRGFWLRSR